MGNSSIKYLFNTYNGRIQVKTAAGDPDVASDDNQELTGSYLNSYCTFKIDGEVFKFGAAPGKNDPPTENRYTSSMTWKVKKVEITQEVTVTNSVYSGKGQTVKIRYWIRNTDSVPHSIGLRYILDTSLGPLDKTGIIVPNISRIEKERLLRYAMVPDLWGCWDSLSSPKAFLHMCFTGPNVVRPDFMTVASRKRLSEAPWDYEPNPSKDFRASAGTPPDSAVELKWEPIEFAPGAENGVAFHYGLAKCSTSTKMPPLDLLILVPQEIYKDEFYIIGEIQNSDESKTIKEISIKAELPEGLELVSGKKELSVKELAVGRSFHVAWHVRATQKGNHEIKLTATGKAGKAPAVNQVKGMVTVR